MSFLESGTTNLAYDLSLFDTEEEVRRPQRVTAKAAVGIRRAAQSVSKSGSKLKLLAVSACIFAALCALNFYSTKKDDMARMVADQQSAYESALDDNALLKSRLEAKVSIGYIEKYATEKLGMQKVTGAQKKYISANTEALIEVEDDDSGGLFGAISSWFGDLLEYIGF